MAVSTAILVSSLVTKLNNIISILEAIKAKPIRTDTVGEECVQIQVFHAKFAWATHGYSSWLYDATSVCLQIESSTVLQYFNHRGRDCFWCYYDIMLFFTWKELSTWNLYIPPMVPSLRTWVCASLLLSLVQVVKGTVGKYHKLEHAPASHCYIRRLSLAITWSQTTAGEQVLPSQQELTQVNSSYDVRQSLERGILVNHIWVAPPSSASSTIELGSASLELPWLRTPDQKIVKLVCRTNQPEWKLVRCLLQSNLKAPWATWGHRHST